MRRFVLGGIVGGVLLLSCGFAVAQNSIDTLLQELDEAKQKHQDVTAQTLSDFFSQVDPAMADPNAALDLFVKAGGTLPIATPVMTKYENETASEKDARLGLDKANLTRLGLTLQLQCGLMHFAVLYITQPDKPDLHDNWLAWLKTAAQIYPQLAMPASATPAPDSDPTLVPAREAKRKSAPTTTESRRLHSRRHPTIRYR